MNPQSATPPLVVGAALLMAVAGIIHLVITPIHYAHAPAHGLFFALCGVIQIALGLLIWRRPSTPRQLVSSQPRNTYTWRMTTI
jgi:hypothetical protein